MGARVNAMIEVAIDSFGVKKPDVSAADALALLMERIEWVDQVGIDVFGIGEHHKRDWLDSAPAILLASAVLRRPVSRAATAADFAVGSAGTIELNATGEEAVVGKTARVVEEVLVGKSSSERTEAIHDSVRRTEVEVEQVPGTTTTKTEY